MAAWARKHYRRKSFEFTFKGSDIDQSPPNQGHATTTTLGDSAQVPLTQLYEEVRLDAGKQEIRVLELHPAHNGEDSEHLCGTLRVVSLPGNTQGYSALSYVWGQDDLRSPEHNIQCNGCILPISRNCVNALKRVRQMAAPITIWVDSICICQSDIDERNHQVVLMRNIFSNADLVYAWLDLGILHPLDDLDEAGMDLLHKLSSEDLLSERDSSRYIIKPGIVNFISNEWFQRGWTFQEVLLATDIVFLTRHHALTWYHVCRGIRRWERHLMSDSLLFKLAEGSLFKNTLVIVHQLISLVNLWEVIVDKHGGSNRIAAMVDITIFSATLVIGMFSARCLAPDVALTGRTLRLGMALRCGLSYRIYAKLHRPFRLGSFTVLSSLTGSLRSTAINTERFVSAFCLLISAMELLWCISTAPHLPAVMVLKWTAAIAFSALLMKTFLYRALTFSKDLCYVLCVSHQYSDLGSWVHRCIRLYTWLPRNSQYGNTGIMQAMRNRQVNKPKDKAYSMYGVLQAMGAHLTRPDYSRPDAEVFKDFFIDLVTWRSVMFGLLVDAGPCDTKLDAPSWVPRWQQPLPSNWIPREMLYPTPVWTTLHRARLCGFPVFRINGEQLTVWSRKIDSLASCSMINPLCDNDVDVRAVFEIRSWLCAATRGFDGTTSGHQIMTYLKYILDMRPIAAQHHDYVPPYQNWLETMIGLSCYRIIPAINKSTNQILEDFAGSEDISSFQIDLQNSLRGTRLLFTTKNGRFGTGSLHIQPGDEIHYISGLPVPMCLRRRPGTNGYEVIGPAIIDQRVKDEIWHGTLNPVILY